MHEHFTSCTYVVTLFHLIRGAIKQYDAPKQKCWISWAHTYIVVQNYHQELKRKASQQYDM